MGSPSSRKRPPPRPIGPGAVSAEASDAMLVEALVEKQEWAAAKLWQRHGDMVYRMAARALGSPHEAEDLTQDVFLRVFERVGSLRNPSALRSFIVSVTIRILKWRLRRQRLRQWARLTATGDLPDLPGRGIDAEETLSRFYRLLDRLSVQDRLLFVLRRVDDMQLQEVAALTGRSEATVKRRLAKVYAVLSELVEHEPVLVEFLRREDAAP